MFIDYVNRKDLGRVNRPKATLFCWSSINICWSALDPNDIAQVWGLVSQWQERLRGPASYESDEPDGNFSPRQPNARRDKREVPRVSSMGRSAVGRRNKILNAK